MVSLPLAGRVGRTKDDANASFEVEAGVGVPRATAFVATPTRQVCSLRSQTRHPPRKGEGKKQRLAAQFA